MKPWCDDDPHCPWHQRARQPLRIAVGIVHELDEVFGALGQPSGSHLGARASAKAGAARLVVSGLSLPGDPPFGTDLREVSFEARAGEILGGLPGRVMPED